MKLTTCRGQVSFYKLTLVQLFQSLPVLFYKTEC